MDSIDRPRIAVLSSGSGSTTEALVHSTHAEILKAKIGLVISNNSNAGVFSRVSRLNTQYGCSDGFDLIQTAHISGKTHPRGFVEKGQQTAEEAEAITKLTENYEYVLFLGYMKKAHPLLVRKGNPKINTHPGPLPFTKGLYGVHVQEKIIEEDFPFSAQTLHVVTEEYDEGKILAEHAVPRLSDDTPDSLFESVQLVEKTYLPVDLQKIINGSIQL